MLCPVMDTQDPAIGHVVRGHSVDVGQRFIDSKCLVKAGRGSGLVIASAIMSVVET